jgi:dienelactone hydrolase
MMGPIIEKRVGINLQIKMVAITRVILIFYFSFLFPWFNPSNGQVQASPGDLGPCTPTSQTITYQNRELTIHYPDHGSCTDGQNATYPLILFAHGFSVFGITNGMFLNEGNGQHLASWGYLTAIPELPDDFEARTTILLELMDYLVAENTNPDSFLYTLLDPDLIGTTGHSLGGATALAIAARDARIKASVGLDPVFESGNPFGGGELVWDPYLEGPGILIPTAILGAPPDSCNADGDAQEIYSLVGANLKAYYHLVGANHWVFADPGSERLSIFCGGDTDPFLTTMSQNYMTAWFNYYLKDRVGDYPYLYGDPLHQDVQAGLIEFDISAFPGLVYLPTFLRFQP